MKCHALYEHICVTSHRYNESDVPWDRVKNHLLGIWHNSNTSLDLLKLHKTIQDITNAPAIKVDLAKETEQIFNALTSHFPSLTGISHFIILAGIGALAFIVMITIFPYFVRTVVGQMRNVRLDLKRFKLESTANEIPMRRFV